MQMAKTEEGSDAGNTDCGNRVDSKQRSVTACSTVQKNRRYVFTPMLSGLRWPGQTVMGSWPCIKFNLELERERTKEEKEREEVLHLFRCYTHTHPAGAGSTLKGKRKKKADTRRANGQKQRRGGGEQTDLRNQPTRRNGPEQNSAHT